MQFADNNFGCAFNLIPLLIDTGIYTYVYITDVTSGVQTFTNSILA